MKFKWQIAYIDLDALQLVLRLRFGSKHTIPMIIFDTGQIHDWKVGDCVDVNPGPMSPIRQLQKNHGVPMDEEDYILTNERTGGTAMIRKNDYECEDAQAWLKDLHRRGLVA
jgi:hypothetical protein